MKRGNQLVAAARVRAQPKPIKGFTVAAYAWLVACDRCGEFDVVFDAGDADRWAVHHQAERHRL
jgi:hypothetical protein